MRLDGACSCVATAPTCASQSCAIIVFLKRAKNDPDLVCRIAEVTRACTVVSGEPGVRACDPAVANRDGARIIELNVTIRVPRMPARRW